LTSHHPCRKFLFLMLDLVITLRSWWFRVVVRGVLWGGFMLWLTFISSSFPVSRDFVGLATIPFVPVFCTATSAGWFLACIVC
jgi:hypothetical protein